MKFGSAFLLLLSSNTYVTNGFVSTTTTTPFAIHRKQDGGGLMKIMGSSSSEDSSSSSADGASGAWSPESWKNFPAALAPKYESQEELKKSIDTLEGYSPLVFAGEVRSMHEQLARACQGEGFLLMGGDSLEAFQDFDVDVVRDTFRIILQMALVLTFGSSMPVIKIGKMTGKFVNPDLKQQDASSMIKGYDQNAQTFNIVRAFSTGGYADISRLHAWNLDFVEKTEEGSRYRKFATKVDESLRFMKAIGVDTAAPAFTSVDFFTAHECFNLSYEQALTRKDSTSNRWYDCASHMVWVGERTRQLDGAHLEFVRGIGNPIGVKISEKCTPEELLRLIDTMNPQNIPGRITVIVRMGAEKIRKNLPGLIRAVQREGKAVLWVSDPFAGSIVTDKGYKTLHFEKVRDELRAFFDVNDEMGTHPGGVNLEMTGEDITECIGGAGKKDDIEQETEALKERKHTISDPRLNGAQALELTFLIAERLRLRTGLPAIEE